jgi:hypothetical protein
MVGLGRVMHLRKLDIEAKLKVNSLNLVYQVTFGVI